MGAAASVAVPENISFAELLRLVPLLTQSSADNAVNTEELHTYFKTNRNEDGFLTKKKFIELVLSFSDKPELRDTILSNHHHAAQDQTLEEITEIHRFRGNEQYSKVHLVDFEVFKNHGSYPCFTDPIVPSTHHTDKLRFDLTIPADQINFENSYVIFISHTWFKRDVSGSKGDHSTHANEKAGLTHYTNSPALKVHIPAEEAAKNIHINTHPDTEQHEQYRVCLSGLQKFKLAHLTNFDKVYIWMDYCCLDLTAEHIEETLNTLSLSNIMACCDCVFTPLFDPNADWEFPSEIVHFYEDYNPGPFAVGPGAYLNRAWCRMEAFFATNVPLMADLTHDDINEYLQRHHAVFHEDATTAAENLKRKLGAGVITDLLDKHENLHVNPFANVNVKVLDPHNHSRRMRLSQRLRIRANSEQRPHVIYGSYEYRLGLPPIIASPLSNLYIDKYAPLSGYVSRLDDISEYKAPVVSPDQTKNKLNNSKESGGVVGGSLSAAKYTEAVESLDNTHYSVKKRANVLEKRDRPSVLRRLAAELAVLMKKGKVGYDGEMNEEGERHGRGIYTYANGEKYIGEWEHGKREGVGFLQHANGDVYNGEFHLDHAQGLCTLRYASGDSYFGELHHGRKTGHGLIEYKSGDIYEGDFLHDKRNGEGVVKYKSGQVYTGCFKDDLRHGQGVLSDAKSGIVLYTGYWTQDMQDPDYRPPPAGTGDPSEGGSNDGNESPHRHHKHHHHHHHHHKHGSHGHSSRDGEDAAQFGEVVDTDETDAHGERHHRKHHHKHSPTPDANGEFSPTPSDDTSYRSQSPSKLSHDSSEQDVKSPKSLKREAKQREEKKAMVKSLYDAQSTKKMLSIAEIERAHHESVKMSPVVSVKKKKLPASSAVQSASMPVLPPSSVAAAESKAEPSSDHKKVSAGANAHAPKGGAKTAHVKKH